MAIKYELPERWFKYDATSLVEELTNAKAAVLSLTTIPFKRSWAERLQDIQLKREVAGTSKIEGADFTETELQAAMQESPEELFTRSQRQAHAAVQTYRWIAGLNDDKPIDCDLIKGVHRRIVSGADDDHCPPGQLREGDQNVTFGSPRHRGVDGGTKCEEAFLKLGEAIKHDFPKHDLLIQALALHYHLGSMHPFLDGNGRTERALEALVLQRAGLRDTLFIAMSNYYYDEKIAYLQALSDSRSKSHDLTPFLSFGLKGIALQCNRLFTEIRKHVSKALFRDVMYDLFGRLKSKRQRVIAERQLQILKLLLDVEKMTLEKLYEQVAIDYGALKSPGKAFVRDLNNLLNLGAIDTVKGEFHFCVKLEWATEITETEFFKKVKQFPKAKSHPFL
ncbi:MAG TPA: Fic family protein [Nitrospirae bacterium]|nr:Fic family protein [Nitrospirota bacterium]